MVIFGRILVFCLLITSASVVAADWTLSADVDRQRIGMDDNLTLTFSLSGEQLDNIKPPNFPDNPDWAFMGSSTSSSTNFQLIGAKMSQSRTQTYHYILAPKRKGTTIIPSLSVSANNVAKMTPTFEIEVVEGSVSGRSAQQQRAAPVPSTPEPTPADIREKIFLSATVDKTEAYVGEQVTVTITLYTQYDLSEVSMGKDAVFNGFWAKELYRTKRLNYERRNIGGNVYNAVVLSKYAIFGLSEGVKKIEPPELNVAVLTSRDFWGFYRGSQSVKVEGRPVEVKVKRLPGGAPPQFDGLVGEFSIKSELGTAEPKTNEAMTFVVAYSGTGNLQNIRRPQIEFPRGIEVYDVQEKASESVERGVFSGSKRYEFILVPRVAREYDLPEIRLAYFDPKQGTYLSKSAGGQKITVAEGKAEESGGLKVVTRGEVMRVGEDIRFIAPDCAKISTGRLYDESFKHFLTIFGIEAFIILLTILFRRRRDRLETDVGYARFTRAYRRAMADLNSASKIISDSEAFAAAVQNSILHYLADRLGQPREGVVFSEIRDRLAERKVSDLTLDEIEGLLERLNFFRFAPGEKETVSRELLESAKDIIRSVDRAFK